MTGATSLDDDEALWRLDLGSVNAYLVDDGDVTLVDAGTPRSVDDIRDGLSTAGYTVADVDRVLVTHFDLDHVGGLAGLDLDCPLYAMEPDASFLDGSRKPPLRNGKGLFQRVAGAFLTLPEGPVFRLDDEESIGGFVAHHTPGHTPGHTAFHHPELGVALVGDLVRENGGELGTLPWPMAYDKGRNRESVHRLAARELNFDVLGMGHGRPLPADGAEVLARLARAI